MLAECRVEQTKRSGPGGQHRNKVATAIVVEHLPSGLRGEASQRRSQAQNRAQAIHRLRVRLALEVRHPPAQTPTATWQERATGGRLAVNSRHADFPALLSEALDVIAARDDKIPPAASFLVVSSSQLIKFLKLDGNALASVNYRRQARGDPPLK